jgi:hypothetical protein
MVVWECQAWKKLWKVPQAIGITRISLVRFDRKIWVTCGDEGDSMFSTCIKIAISAGQTLCGPCCSGGTDVENLPRSHVSSTNVHRCICTGAGHLFRNDAESADHGIVA